MDVAAIHMPEAGLGVEKGFITEDSPLANVTNAHATGVDGLATPPMGGGLREESVLWG